ncbi:MAG TPA: hypothetical protein PK395_19465, partial [bacterium]|nr:hypothetical protein [bacterium]
MVLKLGRLMAAWIAVLSLAAPLNGQPSLIRAADFRAGWGDAEIGYGGTDTPETQDSSAVKPESPPDADPESIQYQQTPGWLFAIGKDRRGHRRIWRMERPLGTVRVRWTNWGSPPSGFEEGSFIFSHGAVWMLGQQSGRPTLSYADVEHPSAQWTGTGRLPIEQITRLELSNDGQLRMEGFDESNHPVQSVGEFLGGGQQVSWSKPDRPPVDSALSSDRDIEKNQPLFFHGEVDLEGNAHILALSWATEGNEQNHPVIRYRTSPERGASYSPWSTKVSGSPLEIARQGRYFEYSIEFPQGSAGKVGDVRVHYVFPEKGKAGGGKSDMGLGGHQEDQEISDSSEPDADDDDNGVDESDTPETYQPENPFSDNQSPSRTTGDAQQLGPQDAQSPNSANAPDRSLAPSSLPEGEGAGSEVPKKSADTNPNESQSEPSSDPGEGKGNGEQAASESDSSVSDRAPNSNTGPNAGGNSDAASSLNALTPTLFRGEREKGQEGVGEKRTTQPVQESGSGIGGGAGGTGAESGDMSPMSGDSPGSVEGGDSKKAGNPEQPSLTPTLSRGEREKEQAGQGAQPEPSEDSQSDAAPGGGSGIGGAEQTGSTPANERENSSPNTGHDPEPVEGGDTEGVESKDLSPRTGGDTEGVDDGKLASDPHLSSSTPASRVVWRKGIIPWRTVLLGGGFGWLGLFWLLLLLAFRRKRDSHAERLVPVQQDDLPVHDPGIVTGYVEKTTTIPKSEEIPNEEPPQETPLIQEPTENPAPAAIRPEPSNPFGMKGIAFLRDRALYILDEKGGIYRSDILGGRFQTSRRVGTAPVHCDDVQLAVSEEAICYLVPPSQLKGAQLFVAPLDAKGTIGRWQISSLPKSSGTPSPIWVENGHVLAIIQEGESISAIHAARIQHEGRLCDWKRVVALPRGIRPESAAISGDRCLIVN